MRDLMASMVVVVEEGCEKKNKRKESRKREKEILIANKSKVEKVYIKSRDRGWRLNI